MHAFTEQGHLYFRLTRDGQPLVEPQDVYAECFAAIAMAELSRATGESAYWDRAVACYLRVRDRLGQPTTTPLLGGPMRAQFHIYAHDMARLTVASVFHEISSDCRWEQDLTASADAVLRLHWKPDLDAMLENVAPDGTPMLDLPEGRLLNPGHAIETAWMLMELATEHGDRQLLDAAIDITLASLERCWDRQCGGLRYLASLDGTPTHPPHADMKLWWPHAEALYALLLGWASTGRHDLADWYQRVHDYAFSAFPDRQHGEWYGWLNREGGPVSTAKADGRKGFFPRTAGAVALLFAADAAGRRPTTEAWEGCQLMLTTPQAKLAPRSGAPAAPALARHYKWELLALLFLAYFFHQGDRGHLRHRPLVDQGGSAPLRPASGNGGHRALSDARSDDAHRRLPGRYLEPQMDHHRQSRLLEFRHDAHRRRQRTARIDHVSQRGHRRRRIVLCPGSLLAVGLAPPRDPCPGLVNPSSLALLGRDGQWIPGRMDRRPLGLAIGLLLVRQRGNRTRGGLHLATEGCPA